MSLIKYALITFMVGLIMIFFLSQNIEPKLVKIANVNSRMNGDYVKISGSIVKSKTSSGVTVLTINDSTDIINAVSFQELNATGNIEIIGKITDYKGTTEIEIETIKYI